MRPRAQSYRNLDGLNAARDAVPWYWRTVAVVAGVMILGGYVEDVMIWECGGVLTRGGQVLDVAGDIR